MSQVFLVENIEPTIELNEQINYRDYLYQMDEHGIPTAGSGPKGAAGLCWEMFIAKENAVNYEGNSNTLCLSCLTKQDFQ